MRWKGGFNFVFFDCVREQVLHVIWEEDALELDLVFLVTPHAATQLWQGSGNNVAQMPAYRFGLSLCCLGILRSYDGAA